MYAEFTDDLIIGSEMTDSQHKELISKVNDLLESYEEWSNQSGAARMLNFLADYIDYHLREEEGLQAFINYLGINEHKEKHKELRNIMQELHEMLMEEEGPTGAFVGKVNEEVRDWLYYHIQTFDRPVAGFKFMRDNMECIRCPHIQSSRFQAPDQVLESAVPDQKSTFPPTS